MISGHIKLRQEDHLNAEHLLVNDGLDMSREVHA